MGNIVYTGVHEIGGHFPAHECPEELVDDIRKMFKLKSVQTAVRTGGKL